MVSLDDIRDLRMYKKPFYLPIVPEDKKKGSAILLLTPNYRSSKITMTAPYTVNRKYFESYYLEKAVNRLIQHESVYEEADPGEYLFEATLDSQTRKDLPDSDFGIPEEKKYPMPDKKHVLLAIRFFNHVEPQYEEELAKNILKKIREFGMASEVHVGDGNRFKPYWEKSGLSKEKKKATTESVDLINDPNAFEYYFESDILSKIESSSSLLSLNEAGSFKTKNIKTVSVAITNGNDLYVAMEKQHGWLTLPSTKIEEDETPENALIRLCDEMGVDPSGFEFGYNVTLSYTYNLDNISDNNTVYIINGYTGDVNNPYGDRYKFIKSFSYGRLISHSAKSNILRYFFSVYGTKKVTSYSNMYKERIKNTNYLITFSGYKDDIKAAAKVLKDSFVKEAFAKLAMPTRNYPINVIVSSEVNGEEYIDERNIGIFSRKSLGLDEDDYKDYVSIIFYSYVIKLVNQDVYENILSHMAVALSGVIDKVLKDKDNNNREYDPERVYYYIYKTYGPKELRKIVRNNDIHLVLKYSSEFFATLSEGANVPVSTPSVEAPQISVGINAPDPKNFLISLKKRVKNGVYKQNKIIRDIARGNTGVESRDMTDLQKVQTGNIVSVPQAEPVPVKLASYSFLSTHSNNDFILTENYAILFEDSKNYDVLLKNALYGERIKSNKEVLNIYKGVKADLPFIKYAYTDMNRYGNKNVFVDLSYYHEIFFRNYAMNETGKNNTTKMKDVYTTLLTRLISDARLDGYSKKTIFIPVLDWNHNTSTKMWMYKNDLNPISIIYNMIKTDKAGLKKLFGKNDVVFCGGLNYFKINFSKVDFTEKKNEIMFTTLIKRMVELGYNSSDPDPEDEAENSPKGIAMDLVSKVEKAKNVEINNVSAFSKLSKEPNPIGKLNRGIEGGSTVQTAVKNPTVSAFNDPIKNAAAKAVVKKATSPKSNTVAANAEDNEDKKKKVVESIAKAAEKSVDSDDAMDKLDKEEEFKKMVEDLQNENDVDTSKSQPSHITKISEEFKNQKVRGKSVKELLQEDPNEKKLPETKLKVASINEDWNHLTFINFDKDYNLDADVIKMLDAMKNWTYPIVVRNLEVTDNSTSEDYVDLWKIECEDYKKTRFTLKVDIPKFIDNSNYLKLRGNEKVIMIQSTLVPIIKTGFNDCQIIGLGGYNKAFVRKFGSRLGQTLPVTSKFIRAITKYEDTGHTDIKVKHGDCEKICEKYELPADYIDISRGIDSIETRDYVLCFNQDTIRTLYQIDNSKGLPIGYYKQKSSKDEPKIIYYDPKKSIGTITDEMVSMLTFSSTDFAKTYGDIIVAGNKFTYAKASILSTEIPVIIICSYLEGLTSTLKKAGVKYEFVQKLDNTTKHSTEYDYIQYSDGYLVYKVDFTSSLLLNGLKENDTASYSIKDVNKKEMYYNFLDNYGGNLKADGIENSYDCMLDPITKEILELYKLPTDYVEVMIHAVNLLADNKFIRHVDQSCRRWRRKELVAGYFYKALTYAYQEYANAIRHTRKNVKLSMKQSAVIDLLLSKDPSVSDLSVNNVINDLECTRGISNKGLVGMNADRAFTLSTRGYDESMLNLIGMDTAFAGSAGINRQGTIDPNIEGNRGVVKTINGKADELSVAKTLTITEACTPLGSTHDDPARTLMTYVQTSKHMVRCENNDPMLITNGADEALAYMSSDLFAYKAKNDGKVVELVQEGPGGSNYMVIQYKNGKADYVSLAEEIKKNSDGGYHIPLTLSTDLKLGATVKEGDIVAYDKLSFSRSLGESGNLATNIGTLAKVAIINTDEGFEDSAAVTEKFADRLSTDVIIPVECVVSKDANVFLHAYIGSHVMEGDTLMDYQMGFDDDVANALLKNLAMDKDQISELGRNPFKTKHTGTIADIKIYRTVDLDEMSDSLRKVVNKYEAKIKKTRAVYSKYGLDTKLLPPTEKLGMVGKTKNVKDGVKIIFFVQYSNKMGLGDKITFYSANKGIIKYLIPRGEEPYTKFRPEEKIDSFMSLSSISGRMTASIPIVAGLQKLMVELDRSVKDLAGIPYDDSVL